MANAAKLVARTKGIGATEALALVTKGMPRARALFVPYYTPDATARIDSRHYDKGEAFNTYPEWQQARLKTLRLDLEAALLRLDDCCSPFVGVKGTWPTDEELQQLDRLIDETATLLRKARTTTPILLTHPIRWDRYQKVDRHFPKLRLCSRMTSLVTRITVSTPPSPLAVIMRGAGSENDPLKEHFLKVLRKIYKDEQDTATVDWIGYEPLLLLFQNAERQRAGETPWTVLRTRPGAPTGPPAITAYVAFLEFELAHLIWNKRHGSKFHTVQSWIHALGDAQLSRNLEPFWAGTLNVVTFWSEHFEEEIITLKRERAAARKRKSRKNSPKKV